MVGLGLRLSVAGGREALSRLVLIAVAVALGVGLLLSTVAGTNALGAQNERLAWLSTGHAGPVGPPEPGGTAGPDGSDGPAAEAVDPLWWRLRIDAFAGEPIVRVDVAATGPDAPVPPGLSQVPRPGEILASPSMAQLLRDRPAAELADRYPGTLAGTIGDAALPAPDTLIVIVGREPADIADDAIQVTRINTEAPSVCDGPACALGVGLDRNSMIVVLSVVAAALLFPVLIFIGGATRLSAARREQRFAAMRLVGASPRQITTLAAVESSVATVAGVAGGFAVFLALRPLVAGIPFSGHRFFAVDLSLTPVQAIATAVGVPVAAAVAARLALRRVTISPLGVTRRVTPAPPRARRLVPLVAGLAELGYLAFLSDIGEGSNSMLQAYAYLLGIFLVTIGLVAAGPWLTMVGSRALARRSSRPAGLIAARRLSDNPQVAFRAISGLVLAVFVASATVGVIGTIVAYNRGAAGGTDGSTGTMLHFPSAVAGLDPVTSVDGLVEELTAVPGVGGVAVLREGPVARTTGPSDLVRCADVVAVPALGRCRDGVEIGAVDLHFGGGVISTDRPMSERTWPAADVTAGELADLPIGVVVVDTDGSTGAVERARTILGRAHLRTFPPETLGEIRQSGAREIDNYRRLANVVLLVSLPIAGCSLAVSVVGSLAERRRPFSLLRLTGVPLSTLRRIVGLEAAVPLLLGVVVSAGAGLLSAALFLRAQLDQTLQPPGPTYFGLLAGGVLVSLAIIGSTLPLLARITGPETARAE